MPLPPIESHEQNRRSWNAVTAAHNSHKADQAGWLRAGGSTLQAEELELLGEVRGLRIVHLQCNCGQDTLSLAALGAEVTGVDISDEAIAFARELSQDSGIAAEFVRADLFHWFAEVAAGERGGAAPQRVPGGYDVAFASYGFIGWLCDLEVWARGIRRALRPGGRFVAVEFHPVAFIWDEGWQHRYPYSSRGAVVETGGVSDYVGRSGAGLAPSGFLTGVQGFVNPHPSREFAWGVGDVLGALLRAGMILERFEEYPWSNGWQGWEGMRALPGDRWTVPEGRPEIPLMFGLVARAP